MQDPNLHAWGAQDRFQAHFIVRKDPGENVLDYTAKTILSTSGHFGSKKVNTVKWNGGKLADTLNADTPLSLMIAQQTVKDATIYVEPSFNGVRIYGKWKNEHDFTLSKTMFDIYDKIAGHIKEL